MISRFVKHIDFILTYVCFSLILKGLGFDVWISVIIGHGILSFMVKVMVVVILVTIAGYLYEKLTDVWFKSNDKKN